MSGLAFKPAQRSQAKARVAISGPAGSGKTWTALKLATELIGTEGRVAVVDTEHGSASLYADSFAFDVLELAAPFHPNRFVEAIQAAEAAGYDALVIDSSSHEWNGAGGCLELHDQATVRWKGNSYAAWGDVTPLHQRFIETILGARMHVFATYRSKTDYLQTEENGKKQVQKVGMAPVARDGTEYEFGVFLEMDLEHRAVVTKTRCSALANQVITRPGAELATTLREWLSDGAPAPEPPAGQEQAAPAEEKRWQAEPIGNASDDARAYLRGWLAKHGYDETAYKRELKERHLKGDTLIGVIVATFPDLTGGAEPPAAEKEPHEEAAERPTAEAAAAPYEPTEDDVAFYGSREEAIAAHQRQQQQTQQPALVG